MGSHTVCLKFSQSAAIISTKPAINAAIAATTAPTIPTNARKIPETINIPFFRFTPLFIKSAIPADIKRIPATTLAATAPNAINVPTTKPKAETNNKHVFCAFNPFSLMSLSAVINPAIEMTIRAIPATIGPNKAYNPPTAREVPTIYPIKFSQSTPFFHMSNRLYIVNANPAITTSHETIVPRIELIANKSVRKLAIFHVNKAAAIAKTIGSIASNNFFTFFTHSKSFSVNGTSS